MTLREQARHWDAWYVRSCCGRLSCSRFPSPSPLQVLSHFVFVSFCPVPCCALSFHGALSLCRCDVDHAEKLYRRRANLVGRWYGLSSVEYLRSLYDLNSLQIRAGRAHKDSQLLLTAFNEREGSRDALFVALGNNVAALYAACGKTREALTTHIHIHTSK